MWYNVLQMRTRALIHSSLVLAGIAGGCASTEPLEDGGLSAFSVAGDRKVLFADGNLQYCPATKSWRFAASSVETLDDANANVADGYAGYVDLFGWGATGKGRIKPTETSSDNTRYGCGSRTIAGTPFDFGRALADSLGEGWRMLTHDEVHYLLMFRPNAEKLFGYGMIDGKRGLFILPDDWSGVDGLRFIPSAAAGLENHYNWYWSVGDGENYQNNRFTAAEWSRLQRSGCVFLPVTGFRCGVEMNHVGVSGHYWTSSNYGEEFANCLCLFPKDLFLEGNFDRSFGLAVRLVRDVP